MRAPIPGLAHGPPRCSHRGPRARCHRPQDGGPEASFPAPQRPLAAPRAVPRCGARRAQVRTRETSTALTPLPSLVGRRVRRQEASRPPSSNRASGPSAHARGRARLWKPPEGAGSASPQACAAAGAGPGPGSADAGAWRCVTVGGGRWSG